MVLCFPCQVIVINARKVFRPMTWKDFSIMNDYEEARKTSYREVRSHWIGIVDNYNQAISYFLW